MQASEFTENKTGKLVKIPEGVWAFVPDPLPPSSFDVSWDFVRLNSEADRALSELAGLARTLPNPHLLTGAFSRREAVLSSRIEGTNATMSDLFLFEMGGTVNGSNSDVREVFNYVRALDYGLGRLSTLPISLRLINEVHERLMTGVRGEDKTPGAFRRRQNYIGPANCKLENATYVPPPIKEMERALDQLEKYIHAETNLPPLIQQALIHYQFEAIHPFMDGNGRVGRMLLTLLLCAEGVLPYPLLYLSAYIERHKNDYYRLLLSVSQKGTWTEWVTFFLQGVIEQSQDGTRRAAKLLALSQTYRQRLQAARTSSLLLRMVDTLFSIPIVTTTQATRILGVTTHTAIKTIEKLVQEGILKEVELGRKRNRMYRAEEIMNIVEAPTA